MVKHIVIFRLKDGLSFEEKEKAMNNFKQGIEALPAVIPTIRAIAVGLNINADEACDICLDSTFDTLDDVRAYSAHPDHQAVAGRLKPFVASRSCVDFVV